MSSGTTSSGDARSRLLATLDEGALRTRDGWNIVARIIQDALDCEAVGIRIIDDDGNVPYEAIRGFPKSCACYVRLSLYKDQCACIHLLTRARETASPALTESGALVAGTAADLRAAAAGLGATAARLPCPNLGFETVGLAPIRGGGLPLGLIHCADHRTHHLSVQAIKLLEAMAEDIGRKLFFDSIWPPSPWAAGEIMTGAGAVCPICHRHLGPDGAWTFETQHPRLVRWSARPSRRVFCPDCLSVPTTE